MIPIETIKKLDLHRKDGILCRVDEFGRLVPYEESATPKAEPKLLEISEPPPEREDLATMHWTQLKEIAGDYQLGDKPEGKTWEEFVIESFYGEPA